MSDETNTPPPSALQALMQRISGLAIGIAQKGDGSTALAAADWQRLDV